MRERNNCIPPASALDIRQASEFAAGHVAGATHLELGDILTKPGALPDAPYVVMCGHGERAMSAASLVEREGLPAPAVVLGGPAEWAMAHQLDLETGT